MDTEYSIIDFYEQFKEKYSKYLKPEINSIRMIQYDEEVQLEIRENCLTENGFEKETIKQIDLSFIVNDEVEGEEFFNAREDIEKNVLKFINDLSPYSIANTLDLFTHEADKKIFKKYNTFNIDK